MTKDDFQKAPRVVAILERAAQQRLQVAVDGGERGAQLVGDVGHELRAYLLEPPELGDVVQHHDDAGIIGGQPQRHRIGLDGALEGPGHAQLASDDGALAAQPAPADQLVQADVADDLEQRRALGPRGLEAEHRPGALVHQYDVAAAIDGQHALDHAVEDRADLGPLVLEIGEPVPQPLGQRVDGAGQHADLVG